MSDHRSRLRPITLGRGTYLLLVLIVVPAGAFIVWEQLYPSIYYYRCVESYIPSVQQRLGFRFGRVSVGRAEDKEERWAVLEVSEGGPMSRAGFRAGDIPVAHHGGVKEFCGSLKSTENGYPSSIEVVNVTEWGNVDRPNRRRRLDIPGGR